MSANYFLAEHPGPGSDASILIGRLPGGAPPPVSLGRQVLWLVDDPAATPGPAAASVRAVQTAEAGPLEAAVDDFLGRCPKHLPSLYVTSALPSDQATAYVRAIDTVAACLESHRRARLTRQADAFGWQANLLDNLADYARGRLPESWAGALAGLPAVVCGAGPSLNASLGALTAAARGAVVFAADSSLAALASAGVTADFAVSIDLAKTPQKCLPPGSTPGRMVLAATSPPAWSEAIPANRRVYLASHQLTLDWLDKQGLARPAVAGRENGGATALELARFLGCGPIYVFGLDLALDADPAGVPRRHHDAVEPSVYEQSGFNGGHDFPSVPGNFSATVPTHVIGDWRALDRRLADWPLGLVTLVTDRGARLRNTTVVAPTDFVAPPPTFPAAATAEALEALAPAAPPPSARVFSAIAARLERFGQSLTEHAPGWRATLRSSGPDELAKGLRKIFATPEDGHLLGAYALKLMPHLLPPLEADAVDWRCVIDELAEVGARAIRAAARLGALAEGP